MARIRTVKPALARHLLLFELEKKSGLPVRYVWALFPTICDREGRFKWRPWELKLDLCPYDALDFGTIMDLLLEHKMLSKYEVNGEVFGCIPTFKLHQVVNQREAQSDIPPVGSGNLLTNVDNFACRVDKNETTNGSKCLCSETGNACACTCVSCACTWGREGKGIGRGIGKGKGTEENTYDRNSKIRTRKPKPEGTADAAYDFGKVYELFPRKEGKTKGLQKLAREIKSEQDYQELLVAVSNYAKSRQNEDPKFTKHFSTWVSEWRDWVALEQQTLKHEGVALDTPTKRRTAANAAVLEGVLQKIRGLQNGTD